MPAYAIEFWYSSTGVPNSFGMLASVPEAADANGNPVTTPVSFSHTPLTPGSRWFYKTRRVLYPDEGAAPLYSDFSAIWEGVAPYPANQKGDNMDAIFGSSTVLGLGLQAFTEPHDKPRQATWLVENPSGRVLATLGTFGSRALKNTTVRRMKTGAGRAAFPFNIPLEGTPNGALALVFAMMLGQPTTTIVGGTEAELTANAAMAATSLTVVALAAAIPSGTVLNFSVPRTTTLTSAAAAAATTLAVAATPSAIPSGTAINAGGVWFRTTSSASSGATSLAVTALPSAIANGATIAYTQNRYVTTSATAAASATSISVVATGFALLSGDSALYGSKYRHEWKNTKRYNVGTFVQLIGDYVEVSPGAFANQLEWTVDYDMDTFITPTLQGNALNQTRRYTQTQAGLDTAATDNLNPFSMIDAKFVIDGVDSDDTKSVTVSVNRNARAKGVLRRKRGVARQTPSITDISLTVNLYETDDVFKAKYFGQTTTPTAEYGITCKVATIPVSLEFATCPIVAGDLPYEWGVIIPKASIDEDNDPVDGPDEIMQAVTLVPNWDGASGTDATFYLVNDMSLADIMTPAGTVTPVPQNHVSTYTSA